MIYKTFELKKIPDNAGFYLLYGKNEGLKTDCVNQILEKNDGKVFNYEEKQIKDEIESFYENVLSGSLFESNKVIIINRASDKIFEIIQDLNNRNLINIKIIVNAGILETRSKLRSLFEKSEDLVCIPTYPDNNETLSKLTTIFFKRENIAISQQNINIIVDKCNGDRNNLNNELNKIKNFNKKNIPIELSEILKLTSSTEEFAISELTDYCLLKNKKKTINILNENNSSFEDNILIIKSLLYKLKRLKKLKTQIEKDTNQDKVISSYKPPIFWKDKEIIKIKLNILSIDDIVNLIKKINNLELLIKKNSTLSNEITNNFILETIGHPNSLT